MTLDMSWDSFKTSLRTYFFPILQDLYIVPKNKNKKLFGLSFHKTHVTWNIRLEKITNPAVLWGNKERINKGKKRELTCSTSRSWFAELTGSAIPSVKKAEKKTKLNRKLHQAVMRWRRLPCLCLHRCIRCFLLLLLSLLFLLWPLIKIQFPTTQKIYIQINIYVLQSQKSQTASKWVSFWSMKNGWDRWSDERDFIERETWCMHAWFDFLRSVWATWVGLGGSKRTWTQCRERERERRRNEREVSGHID